MMMNLQFSFCCILAGLWTHAFHLLEMVCRPKAGVSNEELLGKDDFN